MARVLRRVIFGIFVLLLSIWALYKSVPWKAHFQKLSLKQSIVRGAHATRWSKWKPKFPPYGRRTIPTSQSRLPKIQSNFDTETLDVARLRERRLASVRDAFSHDILGYKTYAWGKDELRPLSGGSRDDISNGWPGTLVNSLDTLWLMNLQDFEEALQEVLNIDFSTPRTDTINIFEATTCYLGGLLSAYDLTSRKELLVKAIELGNLLYVAFDTHSRMPVTRLNWTSSLAGDTQQPSTLTTATEIGGLTLEFTRLSQLTGDPKYYDAVSRVTDAFVNQQSKTRITGLWPLQFNAATKEALEGNVFSFGAMAGSLYEYLPKQYLLLNGAVEDYKNMYTTAIKAAKSTLFFRPMTPDGGDRLLSGVARVSPGGSLSLSPEVEHRSCFVGGMVALASKTFGLDDLPTARKLLDGCLWGSDSLSSGIMPESWNAIPCLSKIHCPWDEITWRIQALGPLGGNQELLNFEIHNRRVPRGMSVITNRTYSLRPEVIESLFILYRITGDPIYQEIGWRMFQNINRLSRTEIAHASLDDVTEPTPMHMDKMNSEWLGATLKYFYLLFSEPHVLSLDDWVFNTAAHPFRKAKSG